MLWVSRVIEAPEAQAGWQGLDVSTVSHELCGGYVTSGAGATQREQASSQGC